MSPHMPTVTATIARPQTCAIPSIPAVQELTFWEGLSEDERKASLNPNRPRIFGEKTGWQPAGLVSTKWDIEVYPAVKHIINSPENYEYIFGRSKVHISRPCKLYMIGNTIQESSDEEPWRRARPTIVSICSRKDIAQSLSNLLESMESLRKLNHGFKYMFFEDKRMKLRTVGRQKPFSTHRSSIPISLRSQQMLSTSSLESQSACGLPILFKAGPALLPARSTIGGIFTVNGDRYGLCAAHPLYAAAGSYDDFDWSATSSTDSDAGNPTHITQDHSFSSELLHHGSDNTSAAEKILMSLSEGHSINVDADSLAISDAYSREFLGSAVDGLGALCLPSKPTRTQTNWMIGAEAIFCPEMDWALIKINSAIANRFTNSFTSASGLTALLTGIAQIAPHGEVVVAYGGKTKYPSSSRCNGVLDGIILPGGQGMIDIWTVESACAPGTSGTFVVNPSTGIVYGMIVASSLDADESYMIPAKDIIQSIKSKWPEGTRIELVVPETVVHPVFTVPSLPLPYRGSSTHTIPRKDEFERPLLTAPSLPARYRASSTQTITREDEFEIDFENPRPFVIERWKVAVDSYKLSSADLALVDNVTDEMTFGRYIRQTVKDAAASHQRGNLSAITSISQIHRPLWDFAEIIQDKEASFRDVGDEVDVSPLWCMVYLNIKLCFGSQNKLRRTARWMTDFRRQLELLISAMKETRDDRSMMVEMSRTFDPTLGILYESVVYLQRHDSDEDFDRSWVPVMKPKIEEYLEEMEGTVRHIRAIGKARQITRLQESRIGETGSNKREILMDAPEKVVFPVDNLPTNRTKYFTGRGKEIGRIHAWLGAAENTRIRTYLIYGRRGIGKTEIALEYAARYMGLTYDAIFWIRCETSTSLRISFAEIATSLELDGADKNGNFEGNLAKVLRWLRHTKKRWLLIYDNAKHKNFRKGFWPVGARGSILLISQSLYPFFEDDQGQGETVPVFSIEESYMLLMAQLGQDRQILRSGEPNMMSEAEKVAANTLLSLIGGYPLAIKHAAKLILNKMTWMKRERDQGNDTIYGFLELFRESYKKVPQSQTRERDPLIRSLDTVLWVTFDALSLNARAILSVLALVSPDVISIDLFLPDDQERLTDKLAFCKHDTEDGTGRSTFQMAVKISPGLQAAVDELVSQGVVTMSGRYLTIHREVQEAFNYQSGGGIQSSFDATVNLLYDAFPRQKEGSLTTDDKYACRRWIQHAIALANKYTIHRMNLAENDISRGIASRELFVKLLADCAWYLFETADYDECLNVVRIGRSACYEKQSLSYAHLLNTASSTYFEQNRLRRSRETAEAALAIREKRLSPDVPDYAIVLANLGNIESAQGNYDEALQLLERAAVVYDHIGDSIAVMRALNYLQIGGVYLLQGKYVNAYSSFQECESILMTKARRNGLLSANLHYAYGNLEFAQQDFVRASECYMRAHRGCMEHNPLHPLTAAVFYKLACVEFEQDHHIEALGYIQKAVEIAEIRSPNTVDGTLARLLWKKAEILLDDIFEGRAGQMEGMRLKDSMELRQREIAKDLEIDLQEFEDDADREKSFDILVPFRYR